MPSQNLMIIGKLSYNKTKTCHSSPFMLGILTCMKGQALKAFKLIGNKSSDSLCVTFHFITAFARIIQETEHKALKKGFIFKYLEGQVYSKSQEYTI